MTPNLQTNNQLKYIAKLVKYLYQTTLYVQVYCIFLHKKYA